MQYGRCGLIPDLPPGLRHAATPVHLFGIHPVALVHAAYGGVGAAPHKQARAFHIVHLLRPNGYLGPGRWVARAKESAPQRSEDQRLAQQCRKTCVRRLKAAIRVQQACAHNPCLRLRLCNSKQSMQRARHKHSIAIQQQKVFAPCGSHCLVVGSGKAKVGGVGNQVHFRKVGAHHLHAAVGGGVVHEPHVVCEIARGRAQRLEAKGQQRACIPIDDDDGDQRLDHAGNPARAARSTWSAPAAPKSIHVKTALSKPDIVWL